jgi:transcriptional regulator with XRE-family HTH domain
MTGAHPPVHPSDSPSVSAALAQASAVGITQAELGRAVHVSERTVQNWAAGHATPTGAKLLRLLDLQTIIALLREVYTDEGITIWLHSRNRNLKLQRPIDLLAEGDYESVVREATSVARAM